MNMKHFLLAWVASAWMLAAPAMAGNPSGAPEDWPDPMVDASSATYVYGQFDRLEAGFSDNKDTNVVDAQAWIGGDYNKAWFKVEGEGLQGEPLEELEFQALFSRLVSPFWDLQLGIRKDARPREPGNYHAVIGFQGLAPQWFEVDAAAFISDDGDTTFRAEFEYEWMLTQRLVLQPRLEINAAAVDIPERGLDAGFNSSEAGLRLQYQVIREFSPYIGISHSRKYGALADAARIAGEPEHDTFWVVGVRMWY
ncbi:MAG: copper resistance protein B [Xanthomonadales bacterium]|nr:copper resistance protein B [Xanthomonadales bacterium]